MPRIRRRVVIGSVTDWVILAVVVVVLFGGAKKIPELSRALGRAMGEFRKGQVELEKEMSDMRASVENVTGTGSGQQVGKNVIPQTHQPVNEDSEYARRRITQLEEELRELKEKAGA